MAMNPEIIFITDIPSPHQVELFDHACRVDMDLGVIYVRRRDPGRQWQDSVPMHRHAFLDAGGQDLRQSDQWVRDAKLVVISGYSHSLQRQWMAEREMAGRAWCFWGERPGRHSRSWVGRAYRQWRLKWLSSSRAPIWGIGNMAIDGYRCEFGNQRAYFNVPYFLDLSRFHRLSDYGSSKSRIPRTLLFSGRLIDGKGVLELAEAFLEVAKIHPDVRLKLLGAGPLRKRVEERLRPVSTQVDYLGFQDWQFLPEVYHSCDVVCVPSKYDGWGMFVPEALASGCPVIATSVTGAAHDLITNGQNGWIISHSNVKELIDAVQEAISLDLDAYRRMSYAAAESAKQVDVLRGVDVLRMTIEQTIDSYDSAYT